MRLKFGLIALGLSFLFVTGLRPDTLPYPRTNARFSDSVVAHWPNAQFLRESMLARNEFPLWRETTFAGQPFAANPLNKTAYPLQWFVLLLPSVLHLNLLVLLHLFIAGSGMWMWARSLGMRKESVVLSVVAYASAPRMFGHLAAGHLDIVYALAWWPWLMWVVKRVALHEVGGIKAILYLGKVAVLMFIADMRVSLFGFVVAGIYVLFLLFRVRGWKSILTFGIAGFVTLILSIDLIVPLALWQPYLNRASLTLADAGSLSLNPINLLGMFIPSPTVGVETITYLGITILVLSLIGIMSFSPALRWAWLAILLFVALYAMGPNSFLWPLLAKVFPGLLWFRVPARIWLVIAFLAPVLAGYGLQWVLEKVDIGLSVNGLKRARLLVVAGMFMAMLLGGFALIAISSPLSGITLLVIGLLLGAVFFWFLSGSILPHLFVNIILGLLIIDLFVFGYQSLEWRGAEYWLDPYRPLAERLLELHADRVYSPTYSLEQQVAEVYGIHLFGGVDPFQLTGVVDAIEKGSGVPVEGYQVVVPPLTGIESDADIQYANRNAIIDTVRLGQWHVSHVVAAYPLENRRLQLVNEINGDFIYTNLDYVSSDSITTVPGWPVGWPDLPDNATVSRLNQATTATYVISAIGWLVFGMVFIITIRVKSNA